MRLFAALTALLLGACLTQPAAQPKAPTFDFEKHRAAANDFLADRHAGLGDEYKKVKVYLEARKQYDRAREYVPEHTRALRGLGYDKKRGEWVLEKPLPDKEELEPQALVDARKKVEDTRTRELRRCADRCRKLMEDAGKGGDERGRRIGAMYLLRYEPNDAEAHKARGHVFEYTEWMPDFAAAWRTQGAAVLANAAAGSAVEGEDEQARAVGTRFFRRDGAHLVSRTSVDEERARVMHKAVEANMLRAMELLGVKEHPFGKGLKYTVTQVNKAQYEEMLTKVLKLEGDRLELIRRLQGTGMAQPWGFLTRAGGAAADDMIGNSVALRVLGGARGYKPESAYWLTTGFSYLVTSHVLGTTSTVRYNLEDKGATASTHAVMPEFTKKSGTPEALREVALYDACFGRGLPLDRLVLLDVNDIDQSAAAKAFALMEFFFLEHKDKAVKWLTGPAVEAEDRAKALEAAFGTPLSELENEWREWVLARY